MNSALQLDTENTLAAFIASKNILGLTASNLFSAHAKSKITPDTKGIYLGLVADPPDWEEMVVNASLKVAFELATGSIDDHAKAPQLSLDHQTRAAAIIELLSQQKYDETKAALNAISAAIQFIGWEQDGPGKDGTSEDGTQLITRLPYVFDVFLTA